MTSVDPPAAIGTTTVIERVGKAWAWASEVRMAKAATTSTKPVRRSGECFRIAIDIFKFISRFKTS
jgi:hypothetical protein